IHDAHAVGAAERDPRLAADRRQLLLTALSFLPALGKAAVEDDRSAHATPGRSLHLLDDPRVVDAHREHVNRPRQLVDRGVAPPAEERLTVRIDRVDGAGESEAVQAFDDHPAWRGTIRCAEHRDRTGTEKRREIDHAPVLRFLTAVAPLNAASMSRQRISGRRRPSRMTRSVCCLQERMCASAPCMVHGSRAAGRGTGRFQSAGVDRETTRSRRANSRFVRSTTSLRECRMVRGASYPMATVMRYRSVVSARSMAWSSMGFVTRSPAPPYASTSFA